MSATPMAEVRSGSSPYDSEARPLFGTRSMLMLGPWLTSIPWARASAPTMAPYWREREVSNVAAIPIGAGRRVTPVSPKATPDGPSDRVSEGMHSRATPAFTFSYEPEVSSTISPNFSARVIRASTWAASDAGESPAAMASASHGHADTAMGGVGRPVALPFTTGPVVN